MWLRIQNKANCPYWYKLQVWVCADAILFLVLKLVKKDFQGETCVVRISRGRFTFYNFY